NALENESRYRRILDSRPQILSRCPNAVGRLLRAVVSGRALAGVRLQRLGTKRGVRTTVSSSHGEMADLYRGRIAAALERRWKENLLLNPGQQNIEIEIQAGDSFEAGRAQTAFNISGKAGRLALRCSRDQGLYL